AARPGAHARLLVGSAARTSRSGARDARDSALALRGPAFCQALRLLRGAAATGHSGATGSALGLAPYLVGRAIGEWSLADRALAGHPRAGGAHLRAHLGGG